MAEAPQREKKRILIVTPEITYLPRGMGNMANHLHAKAGGLADVSATLAATLYDQGADVHVALPHYRQMFNVNIGNFINEELRIYKSKMPEERIHLAEDRIFYYRDKVYDNHALVNMKLALVFQREVINNIIPRVNPDIIHCNDWMTGLIPAVARRQNILSLFTVHNIFSLKTNIEHIEEVGIDSREFWRYLYYDRPPNNYADSFANNYVDFLATGIFSSNFINTVSPNFLKEIVNGQHSFVKDHVRREITNKCNAGLAAGVLNSPDPKFNPKSDRALARRFSVEKVMEGKRENKVKLQQHLGLDVDANAAMFYWPSRLDPLQKGCQLLAEIMFSLVSDYAQQKLQIVVVANGPFQTHFHEVVELHHIPNRISVVNFDERLSRIAYAASDFLFMPSLYEPCGLPQMIGPIYGTLPVVRDTGGIHDTIRHLNMAANEGNGFVFKHYDSIGLRWAVDQAMQFHQLPSAKKLPHIKRIMVESNEQFNHSITAKRYIEIYKKILNI